MAIRSDLGVLKPGEIEQMTKNQKNAPITK